MLLKNNDQFVFQEINGKFVILNRDTGEYFGLNAVGSAFLNLIDGVRDLDSIIIELIKIYEVNEETLRKDIDELIGMMQKKGILSQTGE